MDKKDWNCAIDLYATAVRMVPDNLTYRQCLRGSQRKKYHGNKRGSIFAFLKLRGIRSRIKKARAAENWVEMDLASEAGLAVNPWDSQLNADLGEAALQQGFLEIAVFAYEQATGPDGDPQNRGFILHLAKAYELQKNFTAAIATLEKVMKLNPYG